MSGVTFKIESDNTEKVKSAVQDAAIVALDAAGLQGATLARRELQNTPSRIDTGLLRNSITHAVSGKPAAIRGYRANKGSNRYTKGKNKGKRRSANAKNAGAVGVGFYVGSAPAPGDPSKPFVLIGTNVEYAGYVHEGTGHMAPNRFLKNALGNNKAELEKIIGTVLRKSMS